AGNSLPDPAATTNYLLTDVAGNDMDATGRAFASSNIDDNSQIYVDADKPDSPTSITIAPDGGTVEDLVDYADDYASYFNSTNTGIVVSVGLPTDDASVEEGAVIVDVKIDNGYVEVEPSNAVDIFVDNDNTVTARKGHRFSSGEWDNGIALISISEAQLEIANGNSALQDGSTITAQAYIVDNANNISTLPREAAVDEKITVDQTIPNLVSIIYDNPGATPERTQPYPKDTPIPLRLTFEDESADADLSKVTLLDNGTIDITLNVGTPSTIVSFSQSNDPEFGQTTDASATGNEDYTVASDEYTTAELTVTAVSVSNDLVLRDKAGNPITTADLTADFNADT
ncbi:MAG: hypothetical protein VX199_06330, partial [Chloroflexota bacterium]|nr:hypothetical protein [Chloroflexota bacterium]